MSLAADKKQQLIGNHEFLADVIDGLSSEQKTLPCKYFYDERGSQLFEKICATDEYYVTRTENEIYRRYSPEMALAIGPQALILEPGAGSVKKISQLLQHLVDPAGFLPMDISPEILTQSATALSQRFPALDITPLVVDFLDKKQLQTLLQQLPKQPLAQKRVIFFPGSTIGNFDTITAQQFLAQFAEALPPDDGLLIGVDLVKDKSILEAAYDDKQGITAAFNHNLLHRINSELDGDFSVEDFTHNAVFNTDESRIEMHLISDQQQQVVIGDYQFDFVAGETIHTENSYKYTVEGFIDLAKAAGFRFEQLWMDDEGLFGVFYFSVR